MALSNPSLAAEAVYTLQPVADSWSSLYPANMTNLPNVWLMLGQRRRRWSNIGQTLGKFVVVAGYSPTFRRGWSSLLSKPSPAAEAVRRSSVSSTREERFNIGVELEWTGRVLWIR